MESLYYQKEKDEIMSNPNYSDEYYNLRDNVYSDLEIYLGRQPTEEEIEEEIKERK